MDSATTTTAASAIAIQPAIGKAVSTVTTKVTTAITATAPVASVTNIACAAALVAAARIAQLSKALDANSEVCCVLQALELLVRSPFVPGECEECLAVTEVWVGRLATLNIVASRCNLPAEKL